MKDLEIHKATLVSSDDPTKKGRVKIRIIPYMNDVKEEDLPWYDLLGNASSEEQTFKPPKEGSIVLVLPTGNSYRNGYYLAPDFIEGFFNFDDIESSLSNIAELSDSSYQNIRFTLMENGNIEFYNRVSGEHGIYHSSGTYILIDSSGNLIINTTEQTKITGDNTLVMYQNLNTQLQTLIQNINLELGKVSVGIVGAGSSYTPSTLSLDISTAETQKILGS